MLTATTPSSGHCYGSSYSPFFSSELAVAAVGLAAFGMFFTLVLTAFASFAAPALIAARSLIDVAVVLLGLRALVLTATEDAAKELLEGGGGKALLALEEAGPDALPAIRSGTKDCIVQRLPKSDSESRETQMYRERRSRGERLKYAAKA